MILGNKIFAQFEDIKLANAKLNIKSAEALSYDILLIFNNYILKEDGDDIVLTQKGQGIRL